MEPSEQDLKTRELMSVLYALLDAVDYTANACRPNEQVGAVLDPALLGLARKALSR